MIKIYDSDLIIIKTFKKCKQDHIIKQNTQTLMRKRKPISEIKENYSIKI
jgi:hypothetical protein